MKMRKAARGNGDRAFIKRILGAAAAFLILALLSSPSEAQVRGAEALARIDGFRILDAGGFSYDMATLADDGSSSLMRVSVRAGGEESALVRYREPAADRGRSVLVRGNAFWLYEPGMKTALRISPRQILFGQASAGDISRIGFSSMYDILSESESGGLLRFSLKARPGAGATYDLVDLSASPDYRPVEALCRGRSGTLMKTIRYEKFEAVEGKTLLTEFLIVDEVNKKWERMRLSAFDRSVPPASEFSVQALRFAP